MTIVAATGPLIPTWVHAGAFPEADEDALTRLAAAWQTAQSAASGQAEEVTGQLGLLQQRSAGPGHQAIQDHGTQVSGWLDRTSLGCASAAEACTTAAALVTATKTAMNLVLQSLAVASTAAMAANAPAGPGGVIAAGLMIRQLQVAAQAKIQALAAALTDRLGALTVTSDLAPVPERPEGAPDSTVRAAYASGADAHAKAVAARPDDSPLAGAAKEAFDPAARAELKAQAGALLDAETDSGDPGKHEPPPDTADPDGDPDGVAPEVMGVTAASLASTAVQVEADELSGELLVNPVDPDGPPLDAADGSQPPGDPDEDPDTQDEGEDEGAADTAPDGDTTGDGTTTEDPPVEDPPGAPGAGTIDHLAGGAPAPPVPDRPERDESADGPGPAGGSPAQPVGPFQPDDPAPSERPAPRHDAPAGNTPPAPVPTPAPEPPPVRHDDAPSRPAPTPAPEPHRPEPPRSAPPPAPAPGPSDPGRPFREPPVTAPVAPPPAAPTTPAPTVPAPAPTPAASNLPTVTALPEGPAPAGTQGAAVTAPAAGPAPAAPTTAAPLGVPVLGAPAGGPAGVLPSPGGAVPVAGGPTGGVLAGPVGGAPLTATPGPTPGGSGGSTGVPGGALAAPLVGNPGGQGPGGGAGSMAARFDNDRRAEGLAAGTALTGAGLGAGSLAQQRGGGAHTGSGQPWTRFGPDSTDPAVADAYQKVLRPGEADSLLSGSLTALRGLLHPLPQVRHLTTPGALFDALGLGFSVADAAGRLTAPFRADASGIDVLRCDGLRTAELIVPISPGAVPAVPGLLAVARQHRPPWRGNGLAAGSTLAAPIEEVELLGYLRTPIPHGAELWRIGADGSQRWLATFDGYADRWAGRAPAPVAPGSAYRNGLFTWPDLTEARRISDDVRLGPATGDGRLVPATDAPALIGVTTIGHWRGARVQVLRHAAGRVLIDYLGDALAEATRLGFVQLNQGQWEERWVPTDEVTGVEEYHRREA